MDSRDPNELEDAFTSHGEVRAALGQLRQELAQRKATEEQLRSENARLKTIIEKSWDATLLTDRTGRIVHATPAVGRILGYAEGELVGLYALDLVHTDHRERLQRMLEHPGESEASFFGFQLQARHKDGTWYWLEGTVHDLLEEPSVHAIVINFADITQWKEVHDTIGRGANRAHALIEKSEEGVVMLNTEGIVLYANPSSTTLLGYPIEECVGNYALQGIHPDQREDVKKRFEYLRSEFGHTAGARFRCHRKDGTWLWVEAAAHNMLGEPDIQAIVVSYRDVTEQERAEEGCKLLAAIVESSPTAIIGRTLDGTITSWNRGAEMTFGYTTAEAVGRSIEILVPADRREVVAKHLERVVRGERFDQRETVCLTKDGRLINILLSTSPIRDSTGRVTAASAILQDITKRKTAEKQVREYAELLETLSRQLLEVHESERASIARELHDEIGQALTRVKISLQVLQRSRRAAKITSQLKESIAIVDETIEQVRQLSFDLRPSMLDELGLEASLRTYLDQTARKAGIFAEFSSEMSDPRVHPRLEMTIYRVVQEAVTNVVRHAEARSVWVNLRQAAGELRLEIRDDGTGFDVSTIQHPDKDARNLGLLGMQERVRLAGGQVEISSEPGKGSTVRARFPLAQSSLAP